jgi:uncharacterized protein (TIGR02118 family)
MSVAYLVIYEIEPDDPEEFLSYYVDKHLPLVWNFPNIRGIEIDRGIEGGDIFMITRLKFDNIDDLTEGITSQQRKKAKVDMDNFPPYSGSVRWQTVEVMEF